jgi:hypothetical protein
MAYAVTHDLTGFQAPKASKPAAARSTLAAQVAPAKGFFARLGDALMQSRQRAAERDIARHRHLFQPQDAARIFGSDLPFNRI